MPYRVKYGPRGRRSYRSTQPPRRRLTGTLSTRGHQRVVPLHDYRDTVMKHVKKAVKDTVKDFMDKKAKRPKDRPMLRGAGKEFKLKLHRQRHEKLKSGAASGPVNKGKGNKGKSSATGTCTTHPRSMLPKWKIERAKDYNKGNVWQTVLLSKSSRIPTSNNVLKTYRYPIKAPEALDGERVQSMVFSPFCSHWTGIHTTYFRKVRADGTDLDHDTATPLDVIQNKADIQRHSLPQVTDGARHDTVGYQHEFNTGAVIDAAATQTTTSLANNHSYYDQMLKNIKLDLVFMSSRAFPVKISVSVIRHIQPTAPYEWSTEDKRQLLNNLDNKGLEWANYKVEYNHEFVLPALRQGKKPPTRNIVKDIKTHFMQTNTFNENTVGEDMIEANQTHLGLGIKRRPDEVADGFVSGMCYILIKYRKIQQPQQFSYTSVIEQDDAGHGQGSATASITLPVISEESFDVPASNTTISPITGSTGAPFVANQGNEARASFYVHGTLKYNWGFREDTEAIPSLMSNQKTDTHYRKSQSLNVDPTLTGNTSYGIYSQSPSHVTRSA